MTSNATTFSIVTVTKNAADVLVRCMESVAAQTHAHVEHVIVDGVSRDGTADLARRLMRAGGPLVIEPDDGIYHAMNRGVGLARGEYVLFLGADDYLADARVLGDIATFIDAEGEPEFVYGDLEVRAGNTRTLFCPPPPEQALDLMICGCLPHQATFAHRRLFSDTVGLFDTRYVVQSDYDWFLRALVAPDVRVRHVRRVVSSFAMGGASSRLQVGQQETYAIQNAFALYREPEWMEKRLRAFQEQTLALRQQLQLQGAPAASRFSIARFKRAAQRTLGLVKR